MLYTFLREKYSTAGFEGTELNRIVYTEYKRRQQKRLAHMHYMDQKRAAYEKTMELLYPTAVSAIEKGLRNYHRPLIKLF